MTARYSKIKIPCQAVYNKLKVENLPQQFNSIRRLEKVLISKVTIMPRSQAPKMKGSIFNVPIDIIDTTTSLPRIANTMVLFLGNCNANYNKMAMSTLNQ